MSGTLLRDMDSKTKWWNGPIPLYTETYTNNLNNIELCETAIL